MCIRWDYIINKPFFASIVSHNNCVINNSGTIVLVVRYVCETVSV